MHDDKIVCHLYEGLSEIFACMKCEHVNVCDNYNEHVEAAVADVCRRYVERV